MSMLSFAFNIFYQFIDNFAFLILCALGLAIIFGMMGIINLAHGEFIMLGAYVTTLMIQMGIPLGFAIIIGALGVGLFGGIVDKLIISRLYGRPLDSVVATWGISLLMSQGMLIIFGPSLQGITTPLGTFNLGGNTYSIYRVILAVIAILLLAGMYLVFMKTRFGLESRATMQNHENARSMGTNTSKMYSLTFMLGSALAGLAGGLYAPTMAITPTMGQAFQMQSFVTVIVGGTNPLIGTVLSGGLLGIVQGVLSTVFSTFYGRMGLLLVAIIVLRAMPKGFSGLVEKNRLLKRG